uniref:Beta-glucosidase n=1 Tax=Fagus sylvatica TaxID=28930 RepID=A0A2N9EWC3_FAGSY
MWLGFGYSVGLGLCRGGCVVVVAWVWDSVGLGLCRGGCVVVVAWLGLCRGGCVVVVAWVWVFVVVGAWWWWLGFGSLPWWVRGGGGLGLGIRWVWVFAVVGAWWWWLGFGIRWVWVFAVVGAWCLGFVIRWVWVFAVVGWVFVVVGLGLCRGLGWLNLGVVVGSPEVARPGGGAVPFGEGKVSGGVNPKAVIFYNNLINELLSNGIKPFVTLLHFDTPLALQDEYGGFLSPNIVEDYVGYVNLCFKTFGDRVKHWVTLNEPNGWTMYGYSSGTFAPGRCSSYAGNCTAVTHWFMPKYQTSASIKAASRALDFLFGWFAHPVTFGDYPESMKVAVNHRLPKFTNAQSKLLKGSIDFLSVNYYTSNYAESASLANGVNVTYVTDRATTLTRMADANNSSLPIQDALKDSLRIRYHYGHLSYLLKAIKEGVNVKGYYVWSFLDDFEWDAGYTVRFGLTYIDFKNNLKRYLKYSAYWFKMFLLK